MDKFSHPNVDPSITAEINQPQIDLAELEPGTSIRLQLMEHDEAQLSLVLKVKERDEAIARTVFDIVGGDVPLEIIRKNRKANFTNPDFVNSECIIEGSFTHRAGYVPWITMFHAGHLTKGRSAYIVLTKPTQRESGNHYYPYVLDFEFVQGNLAGQDSNTGMNEN